MTRTYTSATEHAGRLQSQTQTVGGVARSVGYGYDAANRPTLLTHPGGLAVVRTFDARNQLQAVTAGGDAVASLITYDAGMRRTALTFGNGLVEQRSYVPLDNQLLGIQTPGVSTFGYTYDADKRKLSEQGFTTAENQHFSYDNENRVTAWDRSVTLDAQTWTLSKVGDWNGTVRTGTAPLNQSRAHTAVHEVRTITPSGQSALTVGYDAKGNLTSDPSPTPTSSTYAWDNETRLRTSASGTAIMVSSGEWCPCYCGKKVTLFSCWTCRRAFDTAG